MDQRKTTSSGSEINKINKEMNFFFSILKF